MAGNVGMYVGLGADRALVAGGGRGVLVLGPPRSGKTSGLVVPNVLVAPAAVVTTSTKPDVLAATAARRGRIGTTWLWDPTGTTPAPPGVEILHWSPVDACADWDDALVTVRAMSRSARPDGRSGEAAHWSERSEALLAPLVHAAAIHPDLDVGDVVRWVLRHDDAEAAGVLRSRGGDPMALDVLAGIAATDGRERSGIWSTTAGVLAAYRSGSVLAAARSPRRLDPASLAGGRDTVYICAPGDRQELCAPVIVAFLDRVRAGAYRAAAEAVAPPPAPAHLERSPRPAHSTGPAGARPAGGARPTGTADQPGPAVADTERVRLVLDEVATIAPLPDLPSLVAEGGGQGLVTLACLQDLSQARHRWGPRAEGFPSLFGTKVILPGIGDASTLELISRLGGDIDVPVHTVSRGPWWGRDRGAPTRSVTVRRQRALPFEQVSQLAAGTALVLHDADPPVLVRVPPWWTVPAWAPPTPVAAPPPRPLTSPAAATPPALPSWGELPAPQARSSNEAAPPPETPVTGSATAADGSTPTRPEAPSDAATGAPAEAGAGAPAGAAGVAQASAAGSTSTRSPGETDAATTTPSADAGPRPGRRQRRTATRKTREPPGVEL